MEHKKPTFASDNYSGVHPEIMNALQRANQGHVGSYGADPFTETAVQKFKSFLGDDIEVFFAYNGTGANVLGLSAMTRCFDSIICSDLAHINVDESTAPERFTGCKLVTIPTRDGKIYPQEIEEKIQRVDDQHHPQVRVISISQTTEYGTVYSIEELKAISAVAKKHNLLFHMDGSRISNAAVSLKAEFRAFTRDAGVDVLSFGGTKNGMMFGEAVVFFNTELAKNFKYIRKQGMQLHSKMRFISAQFDALLTNDLWRRNASHSNGMAKLLEAEIRQSPKAKITQKVDANGIFVILPAEIIPALQEEHFFYVWNDKLSEARLMCSFDTTEEDVRSFGRKLRELLK
ncbi:L-threonine aldolase [Chryseolinea serpens]|uniref:L-threonine aldolase n=1 Tax=Chryseolinea serpens TaxID=947013 RepID=A0A1M5U387_9BACT|nr:low specificity L-threonine aldolase [Chryseolinea serpens]SHH57565.1 L-threonine aldolase [Chryseolinea serpens]